MRFLMSEGTTNSRRPSWELRLTRREIEALKREREHLKSKSTERELTAWERFRQQEIFEEVSALLRRAKKLASFETVH